jgi:hypothetical protein
MDDVCGETESSLCSRLFCDLVVHTRRQSLTDGDDDNDEGVVARARPAGLVGSRHLHLGGLISARFLFQQTKTPGQAT